MAEILSIKDAIDKAITKTKIGSEYRMAMLKEAVAVCVGRMAFDYIQYISLKKDTLILKANSSSLKSQLMMSQSLLLTKINEHVGQDLAVKDIKIL
jgi:hypothetical protein